MFPPLTSGGLLLALTIVVLGTGWLTAARQATVLRRQLRTDALTGLANRTGLYRAFHHAVHHASRRGGRADGVRGIGVLLLDLDQFKAVNDTHGHAAGNTVLTTIAARLDEVCRSWGALAVRLHGDEFAVLTTIPTGPAAPEAGDYLVRLADRCARMISAAIPVHSTAAGETGRPATVAVTASVGAASAAAGHADLSVLLRIADQRMYQHKTTHHTDPAAPRPADRVRGAGVTRVVIP